jgi:hypothetical protein
LEIELPDGTVLDAPDGADPKAVVKGYQRSQLIAKNPAEYDPNSKQFEERYGPVQDAFTEGVGSGAVRVARGLGNLEQKAINLHPLAKVIGGVKLPEVSDEEIREQDKMDSPLARTRRGSLGQAAGQAMAATVATAPLGALGGLSKGGSVLGRTLGNPTTIAALEGAVGGAAAADPNEQGTGAAKGAATSAIISKFLEGGGRLTKGLVKKNEAVRDLEAEAGKNLDIPISQAASDDDLISRGFRAAYQEGLPNVIGVKGQLARQSKQALSNAQNSTSSDLADALIEEIFKEPVTRGTRTGKILTTIGLGGAGVYGDPVVPLVTVLGGNAMATKTVQRALLGDTAAQRLLTKVVEKDPGFGPALQKFIRSVGGTQAGSP